MNTQLNQKIEYNMQIKWNRKTTEWFRNASDYTGFHHKLAEILLESLGQPASLADLGCGAGMIDFELCEFIPDITCIDQSAEVIELLQKEIQTRQVHNMHGICQKIENVSGCWDSAIMLFVGNGLSDIGHLLTLVKDRILIVYRGGCINNPAVTGNMKTEHSLLPAINRMFQAGVKCSVSAHSLEYGQPFVNLKEAYDYVALYHKNSVQESIRHYVENNVIKTGEKEFPYYLPYRKNFGIFEIKKEENLHLITNNEKRAGLN